MITINGFNEIVTTSELESRVVKFLEKKSREELRDLARQFDIPRGRNKTDTIKNIIESDKLFIIFGGILSPDLLNY